MAEDGGDIGILTTVAAVASVMRVVKDILDRPKSGESTMVAIPSDMELYVLIASIAFAVFFGVATYLWRYAEHNNRKGENRQTNKLFGKRAIGFIGAEMFAIALASVLAFYGAAVAPFKLGILEPELVDYLIASLVIALIAGIFLTILFNEGISGLGKFIKQKADETAEAITEVSEAVKKAIEAAEKSAKELGLNKKQTKKFVEKAIEDAEKAEAEAAEKAAAEAPLEPKEGAQ